MKESTKESQQIKALIIGVGKGGQSLALQLKKRGIKVYVTDGNEKSAQQFANNNGLSLFTNANTQNNQSDIENAIKEHSFSFVSPSAGVPTKLNPNPIISACNAVGVPILTDLDLFLNEERLQRPQNIQIGVTGTNGKSTTVAILTHLLNCFKLSAQYAGNIGVPFFDAINEDEPQDTTNFRVLELSSYQLENSSIPNNAIDFSIFTNITKDHIERHGTEENYISAKAKLATASNIAIINANCPACQTIKNSDEDNRKYREFSTTSVVPLGTSVIDGEIFFNGSNLANISKSLLSNTSLLGSHNISNLASSLDVLLLILTAGNPIFNKNANETLQNAIKTFKGLPHRMETICAAKGSNGTKITFINDSKATNVNSLEKCLEALNPSKNKINLILGGVPKGDKLTEIQHMLKSINCAFLIGQSSEDFAKELNLIGVKHQKCNTLQNAAKLAFNNCKEIGEDSLLVLSPACASFDQFANFEERGDEFKAIAEDICKNNQ